MISRTWYIFYQNVLKSCLYFRCPFDIETEKRLAKCIGVVLQPWIQSNNGGFVGKISANNLLKMSNNFMYFDNFV